METFTETQRFRQWWLWATLAFCTLFVIVGLLIKGFTRFDLVVLIIPLMLALGFYLVSLDTRIDEVGIHYRYFPLIRWHTIAWNSIQNVKVDTHQYTSYGARWDFGDWYYVVDGQWGLHITQKNGKRLVIGTSEPEGLKHLLESMHSTIQ